MLQKKAGQTFVQHYYAFQGTLLLNHQDPDLFIRMAGDMRSTAGFTCDQITSAFAVHVVWQGSGTVVINEKKHVMQANDIFVFYPGLHIKHFDEPRTPWHYTWFSLQGPRAAWALEQSGFSPSRPCRPRSVSPHIKEHVRLLLRIFQTKEYPPFFPMDWAWQFFGHLAEQAAPAAPRADRLWLATTCRALMESDYAEFASIDELSRKLDVERTTVFRHFKNAYGLSPKSFMERHRLKKAEQLLAGTRLRVKEVAAQCGFNDANYFCRVFRDQYGTSPGEWRQSRRSPAESHEPGFERSVNYADFEK
jgi:AraC-like DNA-binding protein